MALRFLAAPVEDWIGTALLFLLFVLMSVNVFSRYLLGTGIIWSEEISRYLLIYIVYIGIATGFRRDTHVRLELLGRLLAPGAKRALDAVNWVICLGFLALIVWVYIDLIEAFHRLRSPASQISLGWAYAAVAIGAAAGILRLLAGLLAHREHAAHD